MLFSNLSPHYPRRPDLWFFSVRGLALGFIFSGLIPALTPAAQAQPAVPKPAPIPGRIAPPLLLSPGESRIDPVETGGAAKNQISRCVTALCTDKQGRLYVGTEGEGIWRYDKSLNSKSLNSAEKQTPAAKAWTRFTAKEGLGDDNVYALVCDAQGRIWAGHLNHGVSVFNGTSWRNYDVLSGPLGERVFDIAVSPRDGSVWMATNAGLTRYLPAQNSWRDIPLAGPLTAKPGDVLSGMSAIVPSCLAFGANGDLVLGTQADGLFLGKAGSDYRSWSRVEISSTGTMATGQELPSGMINDVLVTKSGALYAATPRGLAFSRDGIAWRYLRGRDWNNTGELPASSGAPRAAPEILPESLLREDWITCLAENPANGRLLVGYRRAGWEERPVLASGAPGREAPVLPARKEEGQDYTRALLAVNDQVALGFYGAGVRLLSDSKLPGSKMEGEFRLPALTAPPVQKITPILAPVIPQSEVQSGAQNEVSAKPGAPSALPSASPSAANPAQAPKPKIPEANPVAASAERERGGAPFPAPRAVPTLEELNSLLRQLRDVAWPKAGEPVVAALPGDWRTQGDWLGRRGRFWACLCAMVSPGDYQWGAGGTPVDYRIDVSPQYKTESTRYWVHWLYTDNPRSLEMAPTYLQSRIARKLTTMAKPRREAQADDAGESYSMRREGPNLYVTVRVPLGAHTLSLYTFSPNAQEGSNRFRDYRVSLRDYPAAKPLRSKFPADLSDWETRPELAHARVTDPYGGAWQRFLVSGPRVVTVEINRNHSFNTILGAVTLDMLEEEPPPYFGTVDGWRTRQGEREKQVQARRAENAEERARHFAPATKETEAAARLFAELQLLGEANPAWQMTAGRTFYAVLARWHIAALQRAGIQAPMPALLNTVDTGTKHAAKLSPDAKALISRLVSCYYQLGCYAAWEECQRLSGKIPARDLEKRVKWNGDPDCQGKGDFFIKAALAEIAATKNAATEIAAAKGDQKNKVP